ncbi:auxin response factor 18-like [Hibiscus syriacus]|uniref:Auxin response factor 18-like n=1 Tax=Hibiscus syriacus TaxID=106335 RepID=A0A6A3CX65_HIBSY|nr:auxin response factor 18-like [Hibiscus syriacus]
MQKTGTIEALEPSVEAGNEDALPSWWVDQKSELEGSIQIHETGMIENRGYLQRILQMVSQAVEEKESSLSDKGRLQIAVNQTKMEGKHPCLITILNEHEKYTYKQDEPGILSSKPAVIPQHNESPLKDTIEMQKLKMEGNTVDLGESSIGGDVQSNYVLRPKIEIQMFDGTNLRGWVRKYQMYFSIFKVPKNQKMELATMYLTGKAEIWFDGYIAQKHKVNWHEFTADICHRFCDQNCNDIVEEFNKLTQRHSVEDYHDKFEELKSYMLQYSLFLEEGLAKLVELTWEVENKKLRFQPRVASTGHSNTSYNTLRIQGHISGKPLNILIDSGSTHSFITGQCSAMSKNLRWIMHGSQFEHDFGVLALEGSNMVLGVDWLRKYNPLQMDFNHMTLSFQKEGIEGTGRLELLLNTFLKQPLGLTMATLNLRRFIKGYGEIAKPLTTMLKKDHFKWSEDNITAFELLKTAMCQAPVLALPDFTKGFCLETDASSKGIGAVLSQDGRPVAYLSKALGPKQLDMSIYGKEYLAILMAISNFHTALGTTPFTALYGYIPPTMTWSTETKVADVQKWLQERDNMNTVLQDQLDKAQQRMKHYTEKSTVTECYSSLISILGDKYRLQGGIVMTLDEKSEMGKEKLVIGDEKMGELRKELGISNLKELGILNLPDALLDDSVESILDKENFTLEELLDEEEIIQECKALNSRLINFLRDRAQVEQLLRYVVEEPPEDADSKRVFKFPFIACEIFTCEIDVILKALVDEEELMNLLFSFLEPNRPHSALLAGYFSKVVVCLMLRKTVPVMNHVQVHQDVFHQLVDLIGITSIMEVLVRLVGGDYHVYPNFLDVMQWLADSNLLEMIVDKLSPSCGPEVHANAAETLCATTRNAPSALATNLSSPSFVARIFGHALEDSHSKSGLIHSLSVCMSLLDPKRSAIVSPLMHSFQHQHMYEPPIPVNSESINAMLPKLGDLLMLLNVSSDERILPTTYGELRPPLGKHRLKIVEFISVLLRNGNEAAEKELVSSGTIQRNKVLDTFLRYPYNNALHHYVESIILSCLESKNDAIVGHLLQECDFIGKFLRTDKNPTLYGSGNELNPSLVKQPTLPAAGKFASRENSEWNEWQANVLQERNAVENVYRWACGRPTAFQDRTRDSDEDDLHDRDYDVASLTNNLSQAFNYKIYDKDDNEEDHGALDRDDEDVYFDDESAEVVISSLRLSDDQGGDLFTNSNWFPFQYEKIGDGTMAASSTEVMDEINLNGSTNGGNSSSNDEVIVEEEDELNESQQSMIVTSTSNAMNGFNNSMRGGDLNPQGENKNTSNDMGFFGFDTDENDDLFGDRPLPEWVGWGEPSDVHVGGSSKNPFLDDDSSDVNLPRNTETVVPSNGECMHVNGLSDSMDTSDGLASSVMSQKSPPPVPSLFEDVEFVGVELEGTEKAMEHALKEGIVMDAGPLKMTIIPKVAEKENSDEIGAGIKEFNDANYWRVDQEVAVSE